MSLWDAALGSDVLAPAAQACELSTVWRLADSLVDFLGALAPDADGKEHELEMLCAASALLSSGGAEAGCAGHAATGLHRVRLRRAGCWTSAVQYVARLTARLCAQSLVRQLRACLQLSRTPALVATATAEIEALTEALHDLLLDINYISPQAGHAGSTALARSGPALTAARACRRSWHSWHSAPAASCPARAAAVPTGTGSGCAPRALAARAWLPALRGRHGACAAQADLALDQDQVAVLATGYQDLQLSLANSLATRAMAEELLQAHLQEAATCPSAGAKVRAGHSEDRGALAQGLCWRERGRHWPAALWLAGAGPQCRHARLAWRPGSC